MVTALSAKGVYTDKTVSHRHTISGFAGATLSSKSNIACKFSFLPPGMVVNAEATRHIR
jgi:hypothetical protein